MAIFGLPIDSGGKLLNHEPLDFGRSVLLEFRWDLAKRQCEVSADAEKLVTLPMLNPANKGISYLRIRSTAEATDSAGVLLEHVSMDLTQ